MEYSIKFTEGCSPKLSAKLIDCLKCAGLIAKLCKEGKHAVHFGATFQCLIDKAVELGIRKPKKGKKDITIFVGFLVRGKINTMLDEGDISEQQKSNFYNACLEFHRTAFVYALENFPLDHHFLEHARFLNFWGQKCTFDSVLFVAEKLKKYVQFSPQQLAEFCYSRLLVVYIRRYARTRTRRHEAVIRVESESNEYGRPLPPKIQRE